MNSDLLSESDFKLFKSKDNHAFKLVYEKYYRLINYIANRCGADSSMCDDIVQETFIRLYDNTDQIQNQAHIKNWLSTTARNLSMDRARKRIVENNYSQQAAHLEQQNENERISRKGRMRATFSSENDIHELELSLIGKLIDQVTEETNDTTFSLFYRDGLSAKQIATQMNAPVSTITNRLSRMRKRFQNHFEQHLKNLHEQIL